MSKPRSNDLKKVFLGGTCNKSTWRDELIPLLEIKYFNPVVKEWTQKAQDEEYKQKEKADFCLYVITPRQTGFFTIAEVVSDSIKKPMKTIFCVLDKDKSDTPDSTILFSHSQMESLNAVCRMVKENGAKCFKSLNAVANYLNDR